MKRVLYINDIPVLSINIDAVDVTVTDDLNDELVPVAEYLETTIICNMQYDGLDSSCDYYFKDEEVK